MKNIAEKIGSPNSVKLQTCLSYLSSQPQLTLFLVIRLLQKFTIVEDEKNCWHQEIHSKGHWTNTLTNTVGENTGRSTWRNTRTRIHVPPKMEICFR